MTWRRRCTGVIAGLTMAVVVVSLPPSAGARPTADAAPTQSATPAVADVGKLTVRLAHLSAAGPEPRAQARAAQLPAAGPGSLLRRADGRILTYVRVRDTSAATVRAVEATGARVVHVSPDYAVVTAAVQPAQLGRLAAVSRVVQISEALTPRIIPTHAPVTHAPARRAPAAPASTCGSATSEGDAILQAAAARQRFGVDGTGVTVGVLSDSFDSAGLPLPTTAAQDVASGDLPGPGNPCGRTTPVRLLHEPEVGGFDEGRAMAQIVHDLAPGAAIVFATILDGQYATADYIKQMYRAGATVITDDVLYLEEPFYQRSVIGSAIGYVTRRGVTYTSAAGNSNVQVGGRDVSAYDTVKFRPTACPAGIPDRRHRVCHSFDPKHADPALSYRVGGEANMWIDLHSAQPENGVTTDFDAYLLDHRTHTVLASDTENSLRTGSTGMTLFWNRNEGQPSTVDLVLVRRRGTGTPAWRAVFIQLSGARSVETVSGTDRLGRYEILGHNGDPDAITAAAANWADSSRPETYSSRGPVRWSFGPQVGTTPAARLSTPRTIAKPDVTGTDGVLTSFFFNFSGVGPFRFAGTSAATPHVAGVAALLRQLAPQATPAQVRTAITATAAPMRYGSALSTGHGRVDAYAAARALRPAG